MVRIVVTGAAGRMGRGIINVICRAFFDYLAIFHHRDPVTHELYHPEVMAYE